MLDYLKRLFGFSKPAEQTVAAPYKVEAPVTEPKKCGCGRSETGNCVGLHAIPDAEWATHEKNPNKAPAKKKAPAKAKAPAKKPATKAPAKAKAPAKKPAVKKAN